MSFSEKRYQGATLLYLITTVAAFQFDVHNLIQYESPIENPSTRGIYFGYSVALWTELNRSWIFIGAPRANSSLYGPIVEPGTVFKCEIGKPCKEWAMNNGERTAPQDGSWLGGTIGVGTSGIAVVCAPRWVDKFEESYMRGMCYSARANESGSLTHKAGQPVSPLANTDAVYNTTTLMFGMGESGFSLHIPSSNIFEYVLGVPGAFHWHGTPIKSWNSGTFIIPNPSLDSSVTGETYSGYSVTSGSYFLLSGKKNRRQYVTGAPRAHDMRGQVIVFNFPRNSDKNGKNNVITSYTRAKIVGDQVGEYFGAALATCDINGDQRDDLLVGAPQWSLISDEGRVYILKGNTKKKATEFQGQEKLDGKTMRGRFGSAITCLGDIDYDGYNDFAVGAPYDGNGAVFVYYGSKDDGPRLSQKIAGPRGTRGFGISISEPKDIDGNSHVDVAVGAYLSGHVVLIRSKRVVNMTVTLSSPASEKPLNRNATSFPVEVCSSYSGKYPPAELPVSVELKIIDFTPDAKINVSGVRQTSHTYNVTLKLNSTSCQKFNITIEPKKENFLKPFRLSATQQLQMYEGDGLLRVKDRDAAIDLYFRNSSVLAKELEQQVQDNVTVWFAGDCGDNKICYSNLSIHLATDLTNISQCVIGSTRIVQLNIRVVNTGDEAFGTEAVIYIPNYVQLSSKLEICKETKTGDSVRVTCSIGDPLGVRETRNISLVLDVGQLERTDGEEILINAKAITRSKNVASGSEKTSLTINCIAKTDIGIAGNTDVDLHQYTLEGEEETLDISFQHTFEIRNYEATPIAEVQLRVSFPTHWIRERKEVELVRLSEMTRDLDNEEFNCTEPRNNMDFVSPSSVPPTDKKFITIGGKTLAASPENRTLYINCTNPSFKCKTIDCVIQNFPTARSTAKLFLRFDLMLSRFTPEIIEKKDVIFFVSDASTSLPFNVTQSVDNKSDSILVGTRFTQPPRAEKLAAWIVPTSIFVGLLLLVLLILGLFKFGFFKRSKKEQLEAMSKETNDMSPVVLIETTSSTDALDLM